MNERVSSRALFAIVYTTSISSLYFALGVVAHRALGLTPVVFLVAGLFFALAALTYAEGASLHQERGGSTVFARYAFNELVSFVSGWAIILDYAILVAVTALAATNYLAAFWHPLGHGAVEIALALAVVGAVAWMNIAGMSPRRLQRRIVIALGDLGLQVVFIVLGAVLLIHPGSLVNSVHLGSAPTWSDLVFALTVATVAFTGLEAASSLSGEIAASPRSLRRLLSRGTAIIVVIYVGISFVALNALPVIGGKTALGKGGDAPLLDVTRAFHPHWLAEILTYVVAAAAVVTLIAAANSSMLGLSGVGYSLATNRQIPGFLARLHPQRGTPVVIICLAATISAALVLPSDVELLVGIYAFGAMLAFTIAHASIIALRFRERERPPGLYEVPLPVRIRGVKVPLPALVGAVVSALGWAAVVVLHGGARYVGTGWMLGGLVLYVAYRKGAGTPLLTRVTVPERALREEAVRREFGSVLVPIFGRALDDDIVQTAGRLAGEERDDLEQQGAMIEALWVFEVPVALPLDARLPDAQLQRARRALARAKEVGEEYEGVEVATATVRARRAGQAIVDEARRRGVEVIVLGAEEATRVRSGALLGGSGGPLDNFVGEITKYVIRKAPCRVILTAPAADADGNGDAQRPDTPNA